MDVSHERGMHPIHQRGIRRSKYHVKYVGQHQNPMHGKLETGEYVPHHEVLVREVIV